MDFRERLVTTLGLGLVACLGNLGCAPSDSHIDETLGTSESGLTLADAGWSYADVQMAAVAGAPSFDPATGVFTVSAADGAGFPYSGAYPYGDFYRFLYKKVAGDVEIVVRMTELTGDIQGAAMGVAIRSDALLNGALDPLAKAGSAHVRMANPPSSSQELNVVWRDGVLDGGTYGQNMGNGSMPIWFRLQRVGNDFAVSRRYSDDAPWEFVSGTDGGEFRSVGAHIGFFLVALIDNGTVSAKFDNVYVGPPRLHARTTWIGSTFDKSSTERVSFGTSGLHVGNVSGSPRVYKNSTHSESLGGIRMIDGTSGELVRVRDPVVAPWGSGIEQGAVAGDQSNVYFALSQDHMNGPFYIGSQSLDGATRNDGVPLGLGKIGGMVAGQGKLFVSQPDVDGDSNPPDRIVVVNASTLAPPTTSFNVAARPSALAFDGNTGKLWVIHANTSYPNVGNYDVLPGQTPQLRCYDTTQPNPGQSPCGIINPGPGAGQNWTALAFHPTASQLLVADNGPDQNIKILSSPYSPTPTWSSFGVVGGAYAGSGLAYEGTTPYARFHNPAGVAVDTSGHIYVASNPALVDIRKLTPAGLHAWNKPVQGLGLKGTLDWDPSTDGQDAYSSTQRFSFNPAATVPGSEWSLRSLTYNPHLPGIKETLQNGRTGRRAYTPLVRRLPAGPGAERFLFNWGHMGQGQPQVLDFFRFSGEVAVPAGSVEWADSTAIITLWNDTNANGVRNAGEISTLQTGVTPGLFGMFAEVDATGNVWLVCGSTLIKLTRQPFAPTGTKVPLYNLASGVTTYVFEGTGDAFPNITNVKAARFKAPDTLYFVGTDLLNRTVIGAYDAFQTAQPRLRFQKVFTQPAPTPWFDVAGDKLFLGDGSGSVYVYEATDGAPVTAFRAGPETSGFQAQNLLGTLHAFKRSNGEYLVNVSDDLPNGHSLVFRYVPRTCEATVPCKAGDECRGLWSAEETGGPTLLNSAMLGPEFDATLTPGALRSPAWEGFGWGSTGTGYAVVPDSTAFDITGAITLSAWVKPSALNARQYVIKKAKEGSSTERGYELGLENDGKPFVRFNDIGGPSCGGAIGCRVNAPSAIPLNAWTHLAASYDLTTVRLYVNGVQVAAQPFQAPIVQNQMPLALGAECAEAVTCAAPSATIFRGMLDEARVFARALPPEQMKILARKQPVGHWAFEDTTSGTISDGSGACSGGIVNAATFTTAGKVGSALSFAGTPRAVEVSDGPSFDSPYSFTVAAWLQPAQPGPMVPLSKGVESATGTFQLYLNAAGVAEARIRNGSGWLTVTGGPYPSNGVGWVHLAATYDGSKLRIYRDKVYVAQVSVPSISVLSGAPIALGSTQDPVARGYYGKLDDVRWYRRALSASEVSALP
jgi:hypothetical protein